MYALNGRDAAKQGEKLERRIAELESLIATEQAAIADLTRRPNRERRENGHLHAALVSARRIGAAVGIVMAAGKLGEDAAFAVLSRLSQARRRTIRDVADGIVLTGEVLN